MHRACLPDGDLYVNFHKTAMRERRGRRRTSLITFSQGVRVRETPYFKSPLHLRERWDLNRDLPPFKSVL